ncbi:unnamed protein product [Hermetia illucens]|uniref:Uncharacterized protein n=1 Tax=Hermetia illucens TaxID=343691 RepID=A0A7R8YVY0_HERIL|nr:unnamed protein product [Hermetia illucens]
MNKVNQDNKIQFKGISGAGESPIGKAVIDCLIDSKSFNIEFHVVERYILEDYGAFLCTDFLKKQNASFSLRDNILSCGDISIKIENDDFKLPSGHEALRFGRVNENIDEVVFVPEINTECLTVSNSIGLIDETNRVPISILNTGDSAVICRVNQIEVHKIHEAILENKMLDNPVICDEHMNAEEKASIYEIIKEYKDIFDEIDPKI